MKKLLKKAAESVVASTVAITVSAVLNCLLGHPTPVSSPLAGKGQCAFQNVRLPCAREWFQLTPLARRGGAADPAAAQSGKSQWS